MICLNYFNGIFNIIFNGNNICEILNYIENINGKIRYIKDFFSL